MTLGKLIDILSRQDPDKICPVGLVRPHSWRGIYSDLAWDISRNVTVGAMLAAARQAIGARYEGWKGGRCTIGLDTACHVSEEGRGHPIPLTPGLLAVILMDLEVSYEHDE